ncbi:metal-dependent hydrolase [Ketobacter sp. MCCC 1A13808]|uniref:metal-dependent hydrolase n=1 Tax=Ketobacter sp. MCCC 1A13808 TaxID=2602738 RepID=UPI000F0E7A1B|nr:metal-dependent hydrolase [Ketobacter sp. MCCC 1A13808]MVF10976.1 metal-dependent hydrolase [Ketobacter sp. MCCC 1A13808]RLP56364.1 MAG: metal-dependent hydrolase [Ketobacter sp.]
MGSYQSQVKKSPIPVKPRHLDFGFPDELPRYWFDDNPYMTHFLNALSSVFPEGERFFIETVRFYMDQIEDPELLQDIRGFIGQEAHHGKQHEAFNNLIEKQGYPINRFGRFIKKRLAMTRDFMKPDERLGITIALEHFTAILAHQALADPAFTEKAPKEFRDLILWHAIEETEHKAVAFDVFQKVSGNTSLRRKVMLRTSFFFWLHIFALQMVLLWKDGMPIRPLKMAETINFMIGKPGLLRKIGRDYLDYYKADFHPWQHDNRNLISNWKQRFSGIASYIVT